MARQSNATEADKGNPAAYSTTERPAHADAAPLVTYASVSDRDIITLIGQQDAQALGLLYDRYGARIYTLALGMTGDQAVAEDVVLEVFLTAWQSAARFSSERSVAVWLLGIARRAIPSSDRDEARSRRDGA